MAEHGYKQNINCFSKLYNDIFARVYLLYHHDKNYDELLTTKNFLYCYTINYILNSQSPDTSNMELIGPDVNPIKTFQV